MALPQISSVTDFLNGVRDAASSLYDFAGENVVNPAQGIAENLRPSSPSISNNFSYDVFPEEVSSESYAHYMTITAITGGIPSGAVPQLLDAAGRRLNVISQDASLAPNQSQYAAVIFIPSGPSGSGYVNRDVHEYTDIKLTNLMRDQLGVGAGPLQGVTGYSINPGVQVLYRSTALRSFMFTFLMAPQSETESRSMQSIIQNLRYWAAPRATGILFQSPAEFRIRFFSQNRENPHIPQIRRCVLNSIDVDYAPAGDWSTFSNGHPVAVLMQLNFQEMEIIHKDLIAGGN